VICSPEQLWILNPKQLLKFENDFVAQFQSKDKSTEHDGNAQICPVLIIFIINMLLK